MGINIKREATQQLARAVAELTGESMTSAIEVALAERLERLRQGQDATSARLAKIEAISRDSARRWPHSARHGELSADLYDEEGLPA